MANITIEAISRPSATRQLRLLGSDGTLVFSAYENCVRYICTGDEGWSTISLEPGTVEADYIHPEEPYVSEMADFISAIESGNQALFPNKLEDDAKVLELLYDLEHLGEQTS